CLLREDQAFLGPHMGDLENAVTLDAFESGIEHFLRLLRTEPEVIVHDLHPDYFSTRHARDRFGDLEILAVQHHHAHIASCLAENGVAEPVLGVAFDGTGLGTDGHLWGGEFLQAGPREFQRLGHLSYFPLPGGAQAIREPWRVAWSLLLRRYGPEAHERAARLFSEWDAAGAGILERMITQGVHTPLSCGAGRLFDAASALITGRRQSRYEGQAAIELEQAADPNVQGADEILPRETPEGVLLESEALLEPVVNGLLEGRPRAELAARFHNTMARSIAAVCGVLSHRTGLGTVALSGGVFQNRLLLERTTSALEQANLKVLTQSRVPANDGGLSLGQAVIGGFRRCV
ncbi:MAG: carbamoyltransferase HypF, partial [Deltaproteobacteria bacterium]|nr:carbamoyltransferase HypF [Deltaproteobacteria bacterium]